MRRALDEYFIGGIKTNLSLFRNILDDPDFQAARIDTGFLDRLLSSPRPPVDANHLSEIAAVAAALFAAGPARSCNGQLSGSREGQDAGQASAWHRAARLEGTQRP
jgi:acetyl-CoA carboxylase biotin carboxylase subunit